jgi:hypothetical protein
VRDPLNGPLPPRRGVHVAARAAPRGRRRPLADARRAVLQSSRGAWQSLRGDAPGGPSSHFARRAQVEHQPARAEKVSPKSSRGPGWPLPQFWVSPWVRNYSHDSLFMGGDRGTTVRICATMRSITRLSTLIINDHLDPDRIRHQMLSNLATIICLVGTSRIIEAEVDVDQMLRTTIVRL